MKNLQIREINRIHIPKTVHSISSIVVSHDKIFCVDDGYIYCFTEQSNIVLEPCKGIACITDLQYFAAADVLWFSNGHQFVHINPVNLDISVAETDNQLVTAKWSPNQEFLAVCDIDGKVSTYRSVQHTYIPSIVSGDSNTIPLDHDFLHQDVKIIWDKVSQYFFTCYFNEGYKLRMYDAGGQVVISNLDIPDMLPYVAWRRNTIICATLNEDKFSIAIHEKNGMLRSQFVIDEKITSMQGLEWNEIGDILGVCVTTDEGCFVNLYCYIDCNFILKQQLAYTNANPLTFFSFLESSDYIANVRTADTGSIILYQFMYETQLGGLPNGYEFCADIQGNVLKLWRIDGDHDAGYEQKELQSIECVNPINVVAFSHTCQRCLLVDSYSNLWVYQFNENNFAKIKESSSYINDHMAFAPTHFYNYCFVNPEKVLATHINNNNSHDLYELDLSTLNFLPKKSEENNIVMVYIHEAQKLIRVSQDGCLFVDNLPQHKYSYKIKRITYVVEKNVLYILILDTMNHLYANQIVVLKNVSSFIVHSGYLYVTTFDKKLHCVKFTQQNMHSTQCFKASLYTRQCEDASTLFCGAPRRKHVLVQHARGNTEMVLCRNVALDQLQEYMQRKMWTAAFEYVRVERLDFNLLVDLDLPGFLSNIKEIITTLEAPNLIYTLIMNLKDENVLTTTYKDVKSPNLTVNDNKKKLVCKAILDAVKDDVQAYIKVAIGASYNYGGVQAAIDVLYRLYCNYPDVEDLIRAGVNCLKVFTVASDIEKSCLNTTNTDFAKCILESLNYDPKTYEQLFSVVNRHAGNVYRQYYEKYHFQENYTQALYYLVASSMFLATKSKNYDSEKDIQEILEYAGNYKLFDKLYKYATELDLYDIKIIAAYTSTLLKKHRYEEAGIIFSSNAMWNEAFDAFISGRLWREALHAAKQGDIDPMPYMENLAKSLHGSGNYKDASYLYEKYLCNIDLAVKSLLDGKLYQDAIYCCRNNPDIFDSTVWPEISAYQHSVLLKIDTLKKTFVKHTNRLQVIRNADIAKSSESESTSIDETSDYAESVTSSARQSSTVRSRTSSIGSSRSRRLERKKQDLREGGQYENIALMRALHNIISDADSLCSDVKMLISLLVSNDPCGLRKSQMLKVSYAELLKAINENISVIWPADLNSFSARPTTLLFVLRKNLDELEIKYRYPPERARGSWKLSFLDEIMDEPS